MVRHETDSQYDIVHIAILPGSVLSLEVAEEKQWLFSSAGDNTIRVWSTTSFECLYLVHSSHDNVGDIFTIVWSQRRESGC